MKKFFMLTIIAASSFIYAMEKKVIIQIKELPLEEKFNYIRNNPTHKGYMTDLNESDKNQIKEILLSKFRTKMAINFVKNHPENIDCIRFNRYIDFITNQIACISYEYPIAGEILSLEEKVLFIQSNTQRWPGLIPYIDSGKNNNYHLSTKEELDVYLKDLRKRLEHPGYCVIKNHNHVSL